MFVYTLPLNGFLPLSSVDCGYNWRDRSIIGFVSRCVRKRQRGTVVLFQFCTIIIII